jgi:hypothetical protein
MLIAMRVERTACPLNTRKKARLIRASAMGRGRQSEAEEREDNGLQHHFARFRAAEGDAALGDVTAPRK